MGVTFRSFLEMGNVCDTCLRCYYFSGNSLALDCCVVLVVRDQGDLRYHCWYGARALLVFSGLKECLAVTVETRLDVASQNPFALLVQT